MKDYNRKENIPANFLCDSLALARHYMQKEHYDSYAILSDIATTHCKNIGKKDLLHTVLDSLTENQREILRLRIIELLNDDPEYITQMSYKDLVSDLFFTTEHTDIRDFSEIPVEEVWDFINKNNSELV